MANGNLETQLGNAERLEELARLDLLNSPPEEQFDRLTRLVKKALDVPVALISLVSADCQFFKSQIGLPEPWASARQTPLSHSFCQHVVTANQALRVEDARTDPRVSTNAAIADLSVIAYLGVPIRTKSAHVLGSLCAIDTKPRNWSADDEQTLRDIACIVEDQIALGQSAKQWRQILNAVPQIVWSTLPDGFHDFYNDRWYEFTGVPHGSTDGEGWNGMFHPDDQERAWERWRQSLRSGEPYEIEYRLRHRSGQYRWTLGRALPIRDSSGAIERWFGTCTDIDDLKEAEAERDIVGRELVHRIQNIFALVNGLISIASRKAPEARDFATSLAARIHALSAAHRYVGLGHAQQGTANLKYEKTLHGLIEAIVAPYQGSSTASTIAVEGQDIAIDERAATTLALILHELATNATKYGAIAIDGGSVSVRSAQRDGSVVMEWRERGSVLQDVQTRTGFGSILVKTMITRLGAAAEYDWRPEGLTVTFTIPEKALNRSQPA